jgi:hypothetical protein
MRGACAGALQLLTVCDVYLLLCLLLLLLPCLHLLQPWRAASSGCLCCPHSQVQDMSHSVLRLVREAATVANVRLYAPLERLRRLGLALQLPPRQQVGLVGWFVFLRPSLLQEKVTEAAQLSHGC